MKHITFITTLLLAIFGALLIGSVAETHGGNGIAAAAVWFAGTIAVSIAMRKEPVLFMACGLVTSHQLVNCNTKPKAGMEVTILIGNRTEISSLGYNASNAYIVESITMVTGKKFWKFQGIKQSNVFETTMQRLKYFNGWNHGGSFLIFDNSGATVKQITDEIANGDFVVIVENKNKGADGEMAFEMHGFGCGLVATEIKRAPQDQDTQGAWFIKFGAVENEYESNPPLKVFVTDYAATQAVIAGVTAA